MAGMTCARWLGSPERGHDARRVVVLPGAGYPIDLPGLFLPSRALVLAGWDVWHLDWAAKPDTPDAAVAVVSRALDDFVAEKGPVDLMLAKSLGTFGAQWAADHDVAAVWTTPLLQQPLIVGAMNRSVAPALLIGGNRDDAWVPEAVTRADVERLEIAGANHGWQTGDWRREIEVYGQITSAVEEFAASLRV